VVDNIRILYDSPASELAANTLAGLISVKEVVESPVFTLSWNASGLNRSGSTPNTKTVDEGKIINECTVGIHTIDSLKMMVCNSS
jgi:hypothetical protein